jgi:hypothetical protein
MHHAVLQLRLLSIYTQISNTCTWPSIHMDHALHYLITTQDTFTSIHNSLIHFRPSILSTDAQHVDICSLFFGCRSVLRGARFCEVVTYARHLHRGPPCAYDMLKNMMGFWIYVRFCGFFYLFQYRESSKFAYANCYEERAYRGLRFRNSRLDSWCQRSVHTVDYKHTHTHILFIYAHSFAVALPK